ncbi:heme-degrading domain-containing protein [Pseudarthrobacter sp. H3Y2-7]|uniref:heme-degrading domain-containing protein n=1 Tax=Pseudarthrobacter TaxID=1742993 RepID=UPI0023B07B61|nr:MULTISPECIES: heme-degrading domain-containing protein [unclassified Pseudarthrobacter]MDE8669763.1 heme-degrading domain-containing protein [Pseudarthrobacter sp. H3Y2-7]
MTAEPSDVTLFDPDAGGSQPPGSLEALIARIDGEISELQFPRFSKDDSLNLGLLLVELGKTRKLPIAIDITKGEQVLFHVALDGATPNNEHWVRAKQRTAARYEIPSLLVGLRARLRGGRIEDQGWYDESVYAAHGGSFPVYVAGVGAVATVTVSGLPQMQDHDLVVEALREILGSMRPA